MSRLEAVYELESPAGLARAAEVIAGEQSCGTFLRLPGETDDLRARASAMVESVRVEEIRARPSLPSRKRGGEAERGIIRLSWPMANIGPSPINALATVAGNLFELADVTALRLLDVTFPEEFAAACPGPAFGVTGTRALAGVEGRPLIGTIVKPSVGLSPDDTAALCGTLARGGIDFIKDDELQADGPHCPFDERSRAVLEALDRHAQATGRKVMYAANLTGELDEMKRRADLVQELGGTCLMVSMHWVGLAGLRALREHVSLPLHCHRNGWGLWSRSPDIGIAYPAWQKFWRLAGADHLHVNGIGNKFSEPDADVIASARAVAAPLFPGAPFAALPVFSSGQTAARMQASVDAAQGPDFLFCAGGGIIGHPGGVEAGVAALRQAADAAMAGIPAAEHAATHPELAAALQAFGK